MRRALLGLATVVGIAAAVAPPAGAAPAGTPVAGYLTTADLHETLAPVGPLRFGPPPASAGADAIAVNPSASEQAIGTGFGVAMTDTSAYELDRELTPAQRDRAMNELFSPTQGIGLSFLRVPMAGSDYVVGAPYSYDDVEPGASDPTLASFSVAHDEAYVFPMIRQALALNPAMTVMANPWSPPAWMKADDRLVSVGPDGTLLPQDYPVYARYLVRTLQAYARAGIPVQDLGVQNEPYTPLLLVSGIPNSFLSGVDEGNLIAGDVAPALRAAGLHPRVLAYDDGFQRSESFIPATMALAGADVGGLAFHCYLGDASSMSVEHALYPGLPELETECASNLSNIEPAQMAIRSLRNFASGIQLWNAALNRSGGPKVGNGCAGLPGTGPHAGQQCIAPVTVDERTHTFSLTSDFWALAHFSRFIALGARRIDSTEPSSCAGSPASPPPCGVEDVAFRNPDGSHVLVATAHDGHPHTLTVVEDGQAFSFALPDAATVTLVWDRPSPPASAAPGAAPAGCPLRFVLHPIHGSPIVGVRAYVDGHLVRALRARRLRHLSLPPLRSPRATVRIVTRARSGRRRITVRRLHGCRTDRPLVAR